MKIIIWISILLMPASTKLFGQILEFDSLAIPDCQHYFDKKQNRYIYNYADKKAQFPMGEEALIDFIRKNLKYPKSGIDAQGTVFIEFIVEVNGEITHKSVKKSVHPELEMEAMKMVDSMPDWFPAECEGKRVPFLVTIPIKFKVP